MNWIEFSLSFSAIANFFSRLSIVNFNFRWIFCRSTIVRVFRWYFRESCDESAKKWIFSQDTPEDNPISTNFKQKLKKQLKKKPKQLEKVWTRKKKK